MVQVSAQLTQQDFIKFNFRHFFSRPLIRICMGVLSFIFIVSLLSTIMIGVSDYEQASILDQIVPMLIMPGILALSCWSVYYQSKRNFATTSSVHEPIVYTFTEQGIHLKGRSFESDLQWSVIYKVQETKKMFLFYQNRAAANIVPKSFFDSKQQVKDLRVLIASQQHLKHKLLKD